MSQKNYKEEVLLFEEPVFKVGKLVFGHPNKTFHLRKLARKTGLSTTAVNRAVKKLEKLHLIQVEKTKIVKKIRADLESEAFRHYKRVFNLYQITRSGLVEKLVDRFNNPKAIVLFGSYARGEDIGKSDIDILILSSRNPDVDLSTYQKILKRKINLHVMKDLSESEREFKNSIANGITLYGYLSIK